MSDFESITIERARIGGFAAFGHGVYPKNSILEGQAQRTWLQWYETVEEAEADWPHAETVLADAPSTLGSILRGESLADLSGLPETPPAWFDPRDAGERWNPDD